MSRKLPFKVVHISGSDENHPGSELEIHGPTSKGWQSARFCVYPQEIIISLHEPSKIVKVQILSHQYNIASKIEIFIANSVVPGSKSLNGVKFRRLGYVPLSENEATNYKARELKSVHLDAEGQFIKLIVHKNYVNKVNLYNQVSIIAVNVIGQSLQKDCNDNNNYFCRTDEIITSYMSKENGESQLKSGPTPGRYEGGKFISPLDDLAFDMYQDAETAQLIRRLEDKKRQAVLEERFDYAKKLKQAMSDLFKVGEKLGKFEVEKRRAVEMEDYELAKSKKLQCDEYRLYVYKQLNVFDLLELNQKSKYVETVKEQGTAFETMNTLSPPPKPPSPQPLLPHNDQPSQNQNIPEEVKLPPVPISQTMAIPVSSVVTNNDERPLPALKNGKSTTYAEEPIIDEPENKDEDQGDLHVLTEKEERDAALLIDIFGKIFTRKLFSKSWKYRQESISCFADELNNPTERSSENSNSRISRAIVSALKKGLNDQVFVVLQDSIDLLKNLLLDYLPKHGLSKTELPRAVEKLLPIILKRTADSVPRSRSLMVDTAIEIANSKEIKELNIVPSIVCEPIKSKKQTSWRLVKSQIDMIKSLVSDYGIDKSGFDLDMVMEIVIAGTQHSNGLVRDASIDCIMEIYRIVKEPLKRYFPPDDATTRKNPLYVKLFDGFDKIDGKLTAAERKAEAIKQKELSEKQQKEKVKALQDQLQQLRSITNTQQLDSNTNLIDQSKQSISMEPSAIDVKVTEVKEEDRKQSISKNIANKSTLSFDDRKTITSQSVRRQLKVYTPKRDSNLVMERLCIFCGEQNDKFTDEQLDIHYWKSCPMLKRCDSCTEVVEIAEMNEHLLTECENREKFMKCKVCSSVITKIEEQEHLKSDVCKGKDIDKIKCPLCQVPVASGDENWKTHLIENCKVNSERLKKDEERKPASKVTHDQGRGRGRGRGRGGTQAPRGRGKVSKIPSKTPVRKK